MSNPFPNPKPHNDGLPFALPSILKTRGAVSVLSGVLGVTSLMGLFRVISIQIKFGLGLDPIGSLMSYSGYIVGILAALVLWTLRPAPVAKAPQFPHPGQFGQPDPAAFNPQLGAPMAPTQLYPQAPVQPPYQPPAGHNYGQFDDLLGDR